MQLNDLNSLINYVSLVQFRYKMWRPLIAPIHFTVSMTKLRTQYHGPTVAWRNSNNKPTATAFDLCFQWPIFAQVFEQKVRPNPKGIPKNLWWLIVRFLQAWSYCHSTNNARAVQEGTRDVTRQTVQSMPDFHALWPRVPTFKKMDLSHSTTGVPQKYSVYQIWQLQSFLGYSAEVHTDWIYCSSQWV